MVLEPDRVRRPARWPTSTSSRLRRRRCAGASGGGVRGGSRPSSRTHRRLAHSHGSRIHRGAPVASCDRGSPGPPAGEAFPRRGWRPRRAVRGDRGRRRRARRHRWRVPGDPQDRPDGLRRQGQIVVRDPDHLAAAWDELGRVPCVLEERLVLDGEVSVILARNLLAPGESLVSYPLCANVQPQRDPRRDRRARPVRRRGVSSWRSGSRTGSTTSASRGRDVSSPRTGSSVNELGPAPAQQRPLDARLQRHEQSSSSAGDLWPRPRRHVAHRRVRGDGQPARDEWSAGEPAWEHAPSPTTGEAAPVRQGPSPGQGGRWAQQNSRSQQPRHRPPRRCPGTRAALRPTPG